ncbi:MAG: amidohydrolase [Oscillospiraceae bacterium]|nr:amidohydrolase [Oscillospiraceae bacterium]
MKKIAVEEHFSTFELGEIRKAWTKRIGQDVEQNPEAGMQLVRVLSDFESFRLPQMDACDITKQVVSTSSPSVQGILDSSEAVEKAERINDLLYERIQRHPDRFAGFATLPMQAPKEAASELERCVKKLGFKGALIHGHTNFEYPDEQKFWPVWEAAAALDVPIYLHPNEPDPKQTELYRGYPEMRGATWVWGIETGTMALRIVLSGIFDAFPEAKLIVGHLGENIPYGLWRFQSHWAKAVSGGGPDEIKQRVKLKKSPTDYFRNNVWITTSGNFSVPALKCAAEVLGPERILFAVDYPFEECAEASDFIENADIPERYKQMICFDNAKELLKL